MPLGLLKDYLGFLAGDPGGAGSPSHDTARQSSGEFPQIQTEPCHNSRLFAGFHLVATSIWFIVVTSRLVVSSVHAFRKM